MKAITERPPSFFKVTTYEYSRHSTKRVHYPSFKLNSYRSAFFPTLNEAEDYVTRKGKFYKENHDDFGGPTYLDEYAYVITEIPYGFDMSPDLMGESLSERVYLPDGTLWSSRDYCNFIPSRCIGEEYNYWGRLCRFHGRATDEIRFKPGDIVEVFGFPGNDFWSNDEVNLAVVVKCPPTREDVSKMLSEYLATHSSCDDTCEHALSLLSGHRSDSYAVISEACEGVDHSPTIATFRPTLNVSKQRERKLKTLYEQYKKLQDNEQQDKKES